MAAVVIPQALLVTCKGTNLGTPWANVFGIQMNANVFMDQAIADEIGDAFREFYVDMIAQLNDAWHLEEVIVQDLQTATAPAFDADVAVVDGNATENAMPANFAIVASHGTGFRGKSYRGRTYLGGWTEGQNGAEGSVESGSITVIENAFTALKAALFLVDSGGYELAVVSRKLLLATPITSTTIDPYWDHQDRRKPA